ncbi:MAG: hypothetical protein ISS44_00460, partial [Candidatus Omnitrophica bacterium]|nr:hypothetical protein [Candidatus Omnitrophota bacterium]
TFLSAQEFPPDFLKQQEEYLKLLKRENPKVYEFEKRLFEIRQEIEEVREKYHKGKITQEKARERLLPLLKEEIEIRNNPDYLIEQRLQMLLDDIRLNQG